MQRLAPPPQMLTLDRLAAHDLVTARQLLSLMVESGHWAFKSAVPEYAPFAYSLAGWQGVGVFGRCYNVRWGHVRWGWEGLHGGCGAQRSAAADTRDDAHVSAPRLVVTRVHTDTPTPP